MLRLTYFSVANPKGPKLVHDKTLRYAISSTPNNLPGARSSDTELYYDWDSLPFLVQLEVGPY